MNENNWKSYCQKYFRWWTLPSVAYLCLPLSVLQSWKWFRDTDPRWSSPVCVATGVGVSRGLVERLEPQLDILKFTQECSVRCLRKALCKNVYLWLVYRSDWWPIFVCRCHFSKVESGFEIPIRGDTWLEINSRDMQPGWLQTRITLRAKTSNNCC